jgi:hypothetical protein
MAKKINPFSSDVILGYIKSIDDLSSKMSAQFGVGEKMAQTMRAAAADSLDSMQALGATITEVERLQVSVAQNLGRNVLLSAEGAKSLYASYLVTGQEVTKMVSNFKDVGLSAYDVAEKMKLVVDIARESGVNVESVSRNVLDNMKYLNQYNFEGGVSGLAKMAAQATSLRINMQEVFTFAEKVYNPDGAIEVAAAMQRLGVAQSDLLDPLRLMDLSQNDPAELQNQIVKMTQQFVQLNDAGRFEIMPGAKRQFQEIAKAMGISYTELTKMALGSAELDKKMKEISFSPNIADDKTREMIANMAEAKGGEYVVKVGDVDKKVSELGDEDIKLLREQNELSSMSMEELAIEQLSVTKTMSGNIEKLLSTPSKALVRSGVGTQGLGLVKEGFKELGKVTEGTGLEPKQLSKAMDEAILEGKASFQGLIGGSATAFMGLLDNMSEGIQRVNEKFPILADFIGGIIDKINLPTRQGGDVLKLPGEQVQLLPEDTFAAFTKGEQVLSNLGKTNTQTNTNTTTNSSVDVNHTLNININAPSHVNTNQLVEMFRDTGVSQALGVAVKEAFNNGGLTAPTANKQQLYQEFS